jgi:hypothetical protein
MRGTLLLVICLSNACADDGAVSRRGTRGGWLGRCRWTAAHLAARRLLSVVNRLSRLGLHFRHVPILFHDARRFRLRHWNALGRHHALRNDHAAGRRDAVVVNVSAVSRRATAACTSCSTTATNRAAWVAAAEDRLPRSTVRPRTIAIAVQRGEEPLAGTEAAVALLAGELTIALVARIAAIGRIADPFIDVDVAASTAATPAVANPGKQTMAENAAASTWTTEVRARLATVGTALVVTTVPDDGLGQAGKAGGADESLATRSGGAARNAAASAAKQQSRNNRGAKPASHHGASSVCDSEGGRWPRRGQRIARRCKSRATRPIYRPAKLA